MAKTKINSEELAQDTLSTILNAIVPFADCLQGKGSPFGEYLVNPDLDLQAKLAEIIKFSCGVTLDLNYADNGTKRSQEQWFNDYWNNVDDGKVMASMGDLYRNFKALKKASEQGTVDQKNFADTLLTSLRNDFDWLGKKNWLISSTRIEYAGNKSLEAEIIHHYNLPDLIKRTALAIPVYRDVSLTAVVSDKKGLQYFRTLLDTDDDAETIIQTVEFVGGRERDKIRVWTPATSGDYTRNSHPSRAAGFYDNINQFHVNGYNFENQGRSRGVFLESKQE